MALIVAAIVVLVIVSGGPGGGSPARLPALHPGRAGPGRVGPGPPGPESMFTVAAELAVDPARTLDQLQRLGVDRVHVYLHWSDVAPNPASPVRPSFDATDPAAYPATRWANFDTIMRDTFARGMSLDLALVPPPPRWAEGPGAPSPKTQPEWRPSALEFGQFVRAVGRRYSGRYIPPGAARPLPRVEFWSIWNEPNLGIELAPQARPHSQIEVSGILYRSLVDAGWSAFAATGHRHDTILIGEVAPAGATFGDAPGLFAAMAPLRFLRALYCVDGSFRPLRGPAAQARGCPTTAAATARFRSAHPGLFDAQGFADHPYPQGLAPDQVTPGEPDYAELAEISTLERTLDRLQRVYGSSTRFPIYSTEFGYQTTPPDPEPGTVEPSTAAYYLNWSEYLTWLDPRLRSYDQYLLTDSPTGAFATGLESATGAPKPGYDAYRLPIFLPVTANRAGDRLEVWGCLRPARYARRLSHRPQRVMIQFRRAAGAAFQTVTSVPVSDAYGYFDVLRKFSGSGTVRLAWSYPNGPQIRSRAVTITLR